MYEGQATHATAASYKNGTLQNTANTVNTYVWFDTGLLHRTDYTPDTGDPLNTS